MNFFKFKFLVVVLRFGVVGGKGNLGDGMDFVFL